ncbi:hypothetical protein, conserved [Plasmodium gonderi]|uniref:Uncharacterized protein n=1 Tax=Plasmodium gonderi TaxID=77519 RepID=A0A1Y1JHX4_PLAGO|nr:hypothetical protein, conserved [Plasmodium gonderi]GAW80372.1 hypothetical protein, conserved [Plasmodium gonderi]
MGNCKSYSANFNVYKNNTNDLYENLICNFVRQDKRSFCQKAFVIYEFLKRKLENKDEYVYYLVSSSHRKKVKNAVVYLNEDYNIEILNFLLKLFKKMNNEYYKNMNNFYFSNYYNYFLRDESKFANFYEQMNIIQKIYNFVRLKYILENICLHVYFELYDNSNDTCEMNGNTMKKIFNTNELEKEKSIELFQLNKKVMGSISTEKKKIIHIIKKSFRKIENFSRNNLPYNAFDNFKMANVMCLYILNNNYKIKSIMYNIFTILFFINNYDALYGVNNYMNQHEKENNSDQNQDNEYTKKKYVFKDKVKYSLEHKSVYITYLFICLCLSFDNKIEEDSLFNTNININQKDISFIKHVTEFLNICTYSQKKKKKLFSQENKGKNIYHCSIRAIKNSYINDSLVNSHYICQKRYVKSILNVGNSNYFIKKNMIVFCFILFENSRYSLSCTSSKRNNHDNQYDKSFFDMNRSLFQKGMQMYEGKLALKKKFWKKVMHSMKFGHTNNNSKYYNTNCSIRGTDKDEDNDMGNEKDSDEYNNNDNHEYNNNDNHEYKNNDNLEYKNNDKHKSNDNENDNKLEIKNVDSPNSNLETVDQVEFDLNSIGFFRIDLHNLNFESKETFQENVQNFAKLYTIEKKNNSHFYIKKKIESNRDRELLQMMRENFVHVFNVLKTMRNKEICYISPASYYDESYDKIKKERKTFPNGSYIRVESNDNSNRSKSTEKTFKKEKGEEDANSLNKNYVNFESKNDMNEENNIRHLNELEEGKKDLLCFTIQNELKKPFFIGIHDTFVPFEMDKLILKRTHFKTIQEEEIKKEKNIYKQMPSHARIITKGHRNSSTLHEHESSEEQCEELYSQIEKEKHECISSKQEKEILYRELQNASKHKTDSNKKEEKANFCMENYNFEKNTCSLNLGNIGKRSNSLSPLEQSREGKNDKNEEHHKNDKNDKRTEQIMNKHNHMHNSKGAQMLVNNFCTTLEEIDDLERNINAQELENYVIHTGEINQNDVKEVKCNNSIKKENKGERINSKKEETQRDERRRDERQRDEEENEEDPHLRNIDTPTQSYEEEIYQNNGIDCLKIFIQHKPIGEMSYFVNNKYINIHFDMFKIQGETKKLIFSTYVNSENKVDTENDTNKINSEKVTHYKITLNNNEKFKYIIDLLFLHLNYNRLYFIYIPKKIIITNSFKSENNLFLNSMCCNCDIILENLCITPSDSSRNSSVNTYIPVYFEKINFIKLILFLLIDLVKIYNKIKKLQYHFENKCKEFMKNIYDYFEAKLKKGNDNFYKEEKKGKLLSITSNLLKKNSVKNSDQESLLSNDLNLSSIKRRSNFSEKYATSKEGNNNVDAKSQIMNVSSTFHSEHCTSNTNTGKNANGKVDNISLCADKNSANVNHAGSNNSTSNKYCNTMDDEETNILNNYHLHKMNNEKPFDIGYKYKNIYIKIIDLKLYEFISDYVNYIRENNSSYYLCPYIFVHKFRGLCFLFIPVCSNFYLIFYLFFFHFFNCSNFFNYKISFSKSINEEEISKENHIFQSNNNFLYINNMIRILNIYKNNKSYMKYTSLTKDIYNNNNICHYYKWKKNKIIIDIRNSFSTPYFIRTRSFISFIESTNLHINLKKLYLNKDYMFSLKLDRKNKPPNEFYSNANDVIFMFNYYFNVYTYFYDEKKNNTNKELFHHNRYIIIPYFKDIYISRDNLHVYLKMMEDENKADIFSDKTFFGEDQRSSCEMHDGKIQYKDKDISKEEEEKKFSKYDFIYNLYENCGDIFINYFYLLLNKLIFEIVNEIKLNNFLNIQNFLQLLNKYEVNFDTFFWVLYDNYMNIYKKYCVHAELVKFFNNSNRNETFNFDYLKKMNYNYCNKKKFYIRRILLFSVCVLLSFICKRILEFFVTNLNLPYENVFSCICFFFFSNNKQRNPNDDLHLNLLKSIYFNLFLSLSFVLQYIPLNVQHLNLYRIIRKVKKYKIILAFCLNYICGVNLPFYMFYELKHMPLNLFNDFFSFDKELIRNMSSIHFDLNNLRSMNESKDKNYYDGKTYLKMNDKEHIEWMDETCDYNISNDSLDLFKNKRINRKILKRFHNKTERKKNLNLIHLMIKMNFNACLRTFTFHDFPRASNNILSFLTNKNIHYFNQGSSVHCDLFALVRTLFVNFVFAFCRRGNYKINEYKNVRNAYYSKDETKDTEKMATNELLNTPLIKMTPDFYENPEEYSKELDLPIQHCNTFNQNKNFIFWGMHKLMEKNIFHVLLSIIEIHYSHLLNILPIFMKEIFNLLTCDLKNYLINIFFYIFIRTDKYKICNINNKKKSKVKSFTKMNKNNFSKQKENDAFQLNHRSHVLCETNSKDLFLNNSFGYSTNNYLEIIKRQRYTPSDNDNTDDYAYGYSNETKTDNDETECETENKTETENEAETQTETDSDLNEINKNAKEAAVEYEKCSSSNVKEKVKIILLDNDYNVYLIEFFFKIVLRIIPFFKQKKNKYISTSKSTIIYNLKIILNFLRSFQNIILSMKNNFYVFIYYFFIKGYTSLILLNTHRALKCFKKVFVLIIFSFGNPTSSENSHPFLVYVTYILYVLTVLSKLNIVNFHEHVMKKEKNIFTHDSIEKGKTYQCDNNNNGENAGNYSQQNKQKKQMHPEEQGEERKNNTPLSEDNFMSNNMWLKQKYEVWMYLEIIRSIKTNYVNFNNNIYLVPLNYLFINMKKLFKKHTEEEIRVDKFGKTDDNDEVDKNLKKKNKINSSKKEKYYDNSTLRETILNDKLQDNNLLININNRFISLYPTVKNVKVPKVYLKGVGDDVSKTLFSTTDFEKRTNFSDHNMDAEMKNKNPKEIQEMDRLNDIKCDNKIDKEKLKEQQNIKQKRENKNAHINTIDAPVRDDLPSERESTNDKHGKYIFGRIDKKDISNLLLYNLIYINKMNRKLNKCNFVSFNFKYYHYKKIISDYCKYYKIILETFKKKLCESYYAYTFGNNENGSLAIGRPSYLKLSPTIGPMGYNKNKKTIKKGTDFWFTNNLQLIPIKIKKICMNENIISVIDKKHNLYIGGYNTLVDTRNELNIKEKNTKRKNNEKRKLKNSSLSINEKIEIDKYFTNLRLKKMKKQEKNFLDYNSSSCDSDNLLFGNSSRQNEITNFLKPIFQCEKLNECCNNVQQKNNSLCNCATFCAPLNIVSDNFSSCESDKCSSFDSEDSDITYIKVNDVDEIKKNMNINILLNNHRDKFFYVKKKNYCLKKMSIDNFNIYNSILYSSSYANQYLAHVLPDQKSCMKLVNKFFRKSSNERYDERINSNLKYETNENVDKGKRNYDDYKYSKKYMKEKKKKNDKGNCKKNVTSAKGKSETVLLDSNLNNNKFIYNFIHDIKTRVKFVDIYNGADFVISINNFGHVYSWGNNKYGCLGTGDKINRYAPTLINPGHFFLYDFEKLQIHTNYKTEIKIKGSEKINAECCENILYNSLILETIKKNIHNKNKNSQNVLKENTLKSIETDGKLGNAGNSINANKCKDEDFFTLKTNNVYTSENMFNFENLEVKNVIISVHKIYVPISSIFCGSNHVCAYSNGSIFMWGEQKLGQISTPFENIYFDTFNISEISDSDSNNNYKTTKKNEKKENKKNKISEMLSSSLYSSTTESYYFNMIDKKKIENIKNRFNKAKLPFCKKKFSFNVENPIQNSFNITNNEILLNNRKLKLYSNFNSMNNSKRKKINNNLVLVPIQVCIFNLSYRVKKNESKSNSNNKTSKDSIESKDKCNMQSLINLHYNLHDMESYDDIDNNRNDNKISQKKVEAEKSILKRKNSYVRIFDYLENFIKAEVVNVYMSLFRNDINIYTNIPNNTNINPYVYGMKFYDYNFYDEKYMNVQDYYNETQNKEEFTYNSNNKFNNPSGTDCNKHDDLRKNGINEKYSYKKEYDDSLNSQNKVDILNIEDPNKFVKLMKENEIINPQVYEYIEKEETVCINIKLIVFLFLFVKKKYMTIFLNSILMVSNVSCGEANTVITCLKKSIYDKYYQYIMKNITCLDNYKHMENEKMKSKMNITFPDYYFSSASETNDFMYRNDIYDIKNYTSTIVNWGDKSFDEFKIMNSTYSCSDTSRLCRMIKEILAHYMCIYVCGRDTNNNLCLNNINQSVYTFTRITNNFFYYNFNNFLYLHKYNYYLYYIYKNNVHINHNNDKAYIQNNPLTTFKNRFNTLTNKETNTNLTNSKSQGISPNQFIIIKKIVCSNIVTCVLDIHNNIYMAGDLKHYFPNYFQHIAYGSSPFIKINLNNTKSVKNISINQNNIFLIYDDNSLKILGYNDYIDFFKYNHPIFFTNKHNQKHSYNMLTIQNPDFLVKQVSV